MFLCCWWSEIYEQLSSPGVRIWNGGFGFDADDGLYLLALAAWLHWLAPILLASAICTSIMVLIIGVRLLSLRSRVKSRMKA
jgi:hypothetical protein